MNYGIIDRLYQAHKNLTSVTRNLQGSPAIRGVGKERFAGLRSVPVPQMIYGAPVPFGFRAVIEQGTDPDPETVVEPARVPALVSAGTRDLPEKKSR